MAMASMDNARHQSLAAKPAVAAAKYQLRDLAVNFEDDTAA